jgi:hypothetical protein
MPKDRIRPAPVSCQSCRSKKLKCNRAHPCSNCTARSITCNFLIPPRSQTETTSAFQSNAVLLERIERLESAVLQQRVEAETKYGENIHPAVYEPLTPSTGSSNISIIQGERDQDSQLLQDIGTMEDSLVCNDPPAIS